MRRRWPMKLVDLLGWYAKHSDSIRKIQGPGELCTLCKLEIPANDEEHFFTGYTVCAKCVREVIGAS